MRRIFSIRTILLIILIALFYNEILALGLRVYVAMTDNPRAELLLADYYQSLGNYNTNNANRHYRDLIDKLKLNAPKEEDTQKFNSAMTLGKMYECGQGTDQNLEQAKSWYQEALKVAPSDKQENILEEKINALEKQTTASQAKNDNDDSENQNDSIKTKSGIEGACYIPEKPQLFQGIVNYLKDLRKQSD